MGIFDDGIFGKMFDLNRDGKVDSLEQAMEIVYLDTLMNEKKKDLHNDVLDDGFNDDTDEDW